MMTSPSMCSSRTNNVRYCTQQGCPNLVTHGRCATHARTQHRQTDAIRGTANQRGYTYQWSLYTKARLQRLPVCGMREDGTLDTTNSRCVQEGRTTAAECTDHIIPLRQGGSMWNPSNHLSLCLACNTWKAQTIEQQASHAH